MTKAYIKNVKKKIVEHLKSGECATVNHLSKEEGINPYDTEDALKDLKREGAVRTDSCGCNERSRWIRCFRL